MKPCFCGFPSLLLGTHLGEVSVHRITKENKWVCTGQEANDLDSKKKPEVQEEGQPL